MHIAQNSLLLDWKAKIGNARYKTYWYLISRVLNFVFFVIVKKLQKSILANFKHAKLKPHTEHSKHKKIINL